jgi:hypothetical protein
MEACQRNHRCLRGRSHFGDARQPNEAARSRMDLDSVSRPVPPPGARNLVVLVLDSLRFDSFLAASMPTVRTLGAVERRWSYATWTAPSHFNLLMGLLPHSSPPGVHASEYYKRDFLRYSERLGVPGVEFAKLLPQIYLPVFLSRTLGYYTAAMVSMPVLNPATPVNQGFDRYELMPVHNDLAAMIDRLEFPPDRPAFWLLNTGETHYPYALPGEDTSRWPKLSGVHGVLRDLTRHEPGTTSPPSRLFEEMHERQIRAASYLDGVIGQLFDVLPPDTWVIVTSDHGELFGEDGYFGHGPITHEKVLEVPFVEGLVR